MKSLSVAAISWLLATQVTAAPSQLKARVAGLNPAPSNWPNTTKPSSSACRARAPTGTGSIPSSTAVPVDGSSGSGFTSALYFSNG